MAQLIWEDNSRVEIKILLAQSKAEKIMSLRSCGSASDLILIPRRRKDTDKRLLSIPHHHEGQTLPIDEAVALVEKVRDSAKKSLRDKDM